MPASKAQKVTFSTEGINPVTVALDETPVSVSGGYGGWTVVSRQRRVGLTQWQGKDPIRMAIPILFDGLRSSTGCELDISRLSRMALPPKSGGEPPVIRIAGAAVPNPGPTKWVIENIAWGTTKVIWGMTSNGVAARMRQDAVVNILQYVAEDRVAFATLPKVKETTGANKTGWPKTYTVKTGDTLRSIASHFYGNSNHWSKIANVNNIRDPATIKKGQQLRIPAP